MAIKKTFTEEAAAIKETFNNSRRPTRKESVQRQMRQIQHENEENFLKQFRENDFRELVALMGEEVESDTRN